ncbi:MAG: hypothetical protein QNK23_14360 [Crocinitomicaceae bacterium]|nr:hypothetical protein [Crocinitomicaceae bacterium]
MKEKEFEIDGNTYKVSIVLNPTNGEMINSPAMKIYHIIDKNMTEDSVFYKSLFGPQIEAKKNKEFISRGIWNVALVKINDKEMLIPYNKLKADRNKSLVFGLLDGLPQTFSNEQAILTTAAVIFSLFLWNCSENIIGDHIRYVVGSDDDDDADSYFTALKLIAYKNDDSNNGSFWILD